MGLYKRNSYPTNGRSSAVMGAFESNSTIIGPGAGGTGPQGLTEDSSIAGAAITGGSIN
jgi:hypothetical protein